MKQSLLIYFLFIAFSAFFLSQQTFAQVNTIDFNDLSNNIDLGREYSRDGFTFAINIPDGPPGTPVIVSRNDGSGFEGTACLYDNNLAEGALTQWTITRNDGSGFQFRGIFLQEAGVGASTSGTIQGFKNGNPVGPAKPIQFNSSIAGLKDFAGDPDFFDVDEIQIKAEDINFFLDHFTYGPPFSPVEATVSFEDATYVFDGTERTIEITGTLPDGASVAYQNNTRTNVGTQEATATITGDNFNTLVLTADLTITPADVIGITFEDGNFVFDGTEKSIGITGTLPAGTSVSYQNNTRTNVGTQQATATISGDNFNDLILTAELSITPATVTEISFEDASFVFDGTEKSIEITGTLPAGTSVSYQNNTRTNVGTQQATARITGENFDELLLTAELEITPAPEPSEVILLTPTDEEMDVELIPELTWGAADGADTYELQLSENSDFSDPVIDEQGLSETEFQITSPLDVSTLYYWQVRGVNSGGPGEWSEAFTFTTVPEVPQVVILESPDDGAVNQSLSAELTWQPSERAETYTLTLSENKDLTDPVIEAVSLEQTSFTPDKPLNRESTYYWAVIAVNPGGQSEDSEVWSFTTVPEASEVVILLTPANEAMDVVLTPQLTWNPATGADTYELQLSENADFTDPVIDEGGLEETEFRITDALEVSTLYYWQVRGVNPGGPGEWSEPFTFTTRVLPEAGDGRVLVSNQSSVYIFSGADFGLADAAYSIRIESVSGGGTLSAEEDDELTIAQINSDALTYEPAPGQHGYGFAFFEFTVLDDAGLESEQAYTMSIDLAASSVELTGGKGWRFLTSPSIGNTFGDFLSPITVQGVPGSANPGARDASLYILNQDEYRWELPDAMSDEIDPGKGFIVFGFEDDMPATLTSGQNWLPLDGEYGYEGLFYDPDQGPEGNSHFLLANPHPISLDFCEFFAQAVAENI
ncbi:MAG: fibronectin type III domain-containing protein, partial [Balneolaceae bacterium]